MKTLSRILVVTAATATFGLGGRAAGQSAFGQTWSTLDGGGGPVAGGGYTLNGTIGQPDAGAPLSGGVFSVSGGFWPGVDQLPTLAIRFGVPNGGVHTVILSWANPLSGYVLQQTAKMSAPGGGWTDVTQTPVIVGANKEVTLPANGQVCYFRLRKP